MARSKRGSELYNLLILLQGSRALYSTYILLVRKIKKHPKGAKALRKASVARPATRSHVRQRSPRGHPPTAPLLSIGLSIFSTIGISRYIGWFRPLIS